MGFDDVLEILDEKWPANRTLMLRTVSKNVKEIVDLIKPRIVVKIKYKQKALKTVSLRLDVMSKKYNITSLVLSGWSDYCYKNNELALVINNSPVLERLDLSYNKITDDILNSIIKPLQQCRDLKYLKLNRNYIDGKMIANIISMLSQWQKLKYIDLSNNHTPSVVAFLLFNQFKREQKKAQTQIILII